MKMTGLTFLKLAVAAIAICLSVSSASAESLNASFTLPFEVHWGKAVLPAGAYTITFETRYGPALVRAGNGHGRALVMPVTVSQAAKDQPSALVVTRIENGYDVRYLNLREANVSFGYRLANESQRNVLGKVDKPEAVTILMTPK
jgi:hypothetical protein